MESEILKIFKKRKNKKSIGMKEVSPYLFLMPMTHLINLLFSTGISKLYDMYYIEKANLLTPFQHGLRQGHSTNTVNHKLLIKIIEALENNQLPRDSFLIYLEPLIL